MNDIPSDIIEHISTFLKTHECLTLSVVTKQDWKINRNRAITIEIMSLYEYVRNSWWMKVDPWNVINSLSLSLLGTKKCSYFSNSRALRWVQTRPGVQITQLRMEMDGKAHQRLSHHRATRSIGNHEFRDQDFCYYYNPAYVSDERFSPFASPPSRVEKIRYTNKVITITYLPPKNKRLRINMSLTLRALVR